ncbi:MAG TPA: DUF3826 domain-containing protein [Candidatus Sulfotelmatobacter sp.]|jgi:hypothetical protein|nr:DUF3826 domain-containing protein [Candidatus Sulfotelmatobacter sp.]
MNPQSIITNMRFIVRQLAVPAAGLLLALAVNVVSAADTNVSVTASGGVKFTSRTVGLDIVKEVVNPDKTTSLTFHWSEKGNDYQRTVTANEQTIVVVDGQIKKFSELPAEQFHAKAVATVGADGVTVVLLRFGKKPLPKDQLTAEQAAMIASLAPPPTAASDAALNKRVAGIVDSLNLTNTSQQERISSVLTAFLRAVRDAHNAGLQLDPVVHPKFVAGLQADLTPEQVESVKDRLTANKLPITFKVYHQILPNLKPEDDAKILAWLQEAREQSLDAKNVEDMTPIFKKYKTEIEHYLDKQGYDWDKSYKAFVDGQKSKASQ